MFTLYTIQQFEFDYRNNELFIIAHCKKNGKGNASTLSKTINKCKREMKAFLKNTHAKKGIIKLSGRYDFDVDAEFDKIVSEIRSSHG